MGLQESSTGRRGFRSRAFAVASPLAVVLGLAARLGAIDLIDAGQLGDRGVTILGSEAPWLGPNLLDACGLGDVDGDGLGDLMVIEVVPEDDMVPPTSTTTSAVLVFGDASLHGTYSLLAPATRHGVFRSSSPPEAFDGPLRAGPVGDLDQDGFADFAIGADSGGGRLYLVYGSRDLEGEHVLETVGTPALPGIQLFSASPDVHGLGRTWVPVGDVDGDGEADLAIGAPFDRTVANGAGTVFLLLGARNLPGEVDLAQVGTSVRGSVILGALGRFYLGYGLAAAGDVDADGLDDFLIGENYQVHLVRGRAEWPAAIDTGDLATIPGWTRFQGFGTGTVQSVESGHLAPAGDMDADGHDDFVIADPGWNAFTGARESRTYLVRGRDDFPAVVERADLPALSVTFRPFRTATSFGGCVAPAGDLNLDGVQDLLFGAPDASPDGRDRAGEAYALFGRSAYPPEVDLSRAFEGIRILGGAARHELGTRVSAAGDVNGDGLPDFLTYAPFRALRDFPSDFGRAVIVWGYGSGPPPFTLVGIAPPFGPVRGDTEVVLRGSGFRGAPRVLFGERPAASAVVRSSSEIVARTPVAVAPGKVDVSVTIEGMPRTIPEGFEYTENRPEVDLQALGRGGLVVEAADWTLLGDVAAFGDITGDDVAELMLSESVGEAWSVVVVRGGGGLPQILRVDEPSPRVTRIRSDTWPAADVVAIQCLGDVDGDGIGDLAIGGAGALGYLVFGRSVLPEEIVLEDEVLSGRAVVLEKGTLGSLDRVHREFARAGDLTGDGVEDFALGIVVTRPNPDPEGSPGFLDDAGEIVIVAGRRSWPEAIDVDAPAFVVSRIEGDVDGQALGRELAAAGDLNGDGIEDLVASTVAATAIGPAVVIHGSRSLPAETTVEDLLEAGLGRAIELELRHGPATNHRLHVARAGDVDRDGHDDLLLGAQFGGKDFEGITYLVRGGASPPPFLHLDEFPEAPDGVLRILGESEETQSRGAVLAGDFDADGHDDVLIAAGSVIEGQNLATAHGVTFLVLGRPDLPVRIDLAELRGQGIRMETRAPGICTLPAREPGDLNGDGLPDFACREVREQLAPEGEPRHHRVYVVYNLGAGAPFVRGDASFDETVDISDAVFALGYLFLGGAAPRCEDSADSNDDGRIEISDAVYLLNHLFLGGPEPPAPYPEAGRDPTEDELGCRGY